MLAFSRRLVVLLTASGFALSACSSEPDAGDDPTGTASAERSASAPSEPSSTGTSGRTFGKTVVTGLDVPWGLAHLPDGSALVTQRDKGDILHLRAGAQPRSVLTIDDVRPDQEGGLLGIAISPQFATDRTVFVYYTGERDNRVERLRWNGSRLERDKVILTGIPKASFHNGGRLAFGPDKRLYVTTGDAGVTSRAQDRSSLGGKILRITQSGAAAPGNPFEGSRVWSYGHRNVQGIAWDSSDRMFATEFGQNTWDELNRIQPGKNYGWPTVEGKGGSSRFVDPLITWRTRDASPSGLAIADDTAYVAALVGRRVWQVPLNDGRAGRPTSADTPDLGRVRTVEVASDGRLWVMSNNTFRGSERPGDDRIVTWKP